jgi:hypothetical protein
MTVKYWEKVIHMLLEVRMRKPMRFSKLKLMGILWLVQHFTVL